VAILQGFIRFRRDCVRNTFTPKRHEFSVQTEVLTFSSGKVGQFDGQE
jgi:hypothetical protein